MRNEVKFTWCERSDQASRIKILMGEDPYRGQSRSKPKYLCCLLTPRGGKNLRREHVRLGEQRELYSEIELGLINFLVKPNKF